MELSSTTDPARRSFLSVDADSCFPIQNLPFGVFKPRNGKPRCGVAIGDFVLDLAVLDGADLLPSFGEVGLFSDSTLNRLGSLGRAAWRTLRCRLSQLLDIDEPAIRDNASFRKLALHPRGEVQMLLPMAIGDYTDFYASKEHATNVGTMFRGADNALQPNWLHLPVGYHGRASSVVVSGTPVHRPSGQRKGPDDEVPGFGPSQAIDFELEMGFVIGSGNQLSESIPVEQAEDHVFGLVLVNDWSARDIQAWEYVPLGPFLGKSFCTSISPWIVTLDALAPFRCPGPQQVPAPLPYLQSSQPGAFEIELEVKLTTAAITDPVLLSRSNCKYLYWSMAQQLAHHTSNGCNMRPGDLLASGTISGPSPDAYGSMLELAWNRQRPIKLPDGDTRVMLADGDAITMQGWAQGDGFRVGFGEVTGVVG